jgi:hypothetical protein
LDLLEIGHVGNTLSPRCRLARHATVPTGSDVAPAPMGKEHS